MNVINALAISCIRACHSFTNIILHQFFNSMKLTHTLITTLWYAGQHAMAMPTPDDPVSALDQQSLLNQQCKNLDAINAPPVDFGGTQYITTGNPNAAAVGYTKPE